MTGAGFEVRKAAVIGAGVMGAQIAAHLANGGTPVLLLDVVPREGGRNSLAEAAIARLAKAEPPPLMRRDGARLISPGNVEDHWHLLAETDWIIEAVVEDPGVKRTLYERLEHTVPPDRLISSNTSTLPLRMLTERSTGSFRRRFMITHFFNPPRHMRLLELVAGPQLRPELLEGIRRFADLRLGKTCVACKDTPGFIANRIGTYWLQNGFIEALERGLTVEEADAALAPFGIPKTGVFGLLDLIGLDLLPHVLTSLCRALPADDPFHRIAEMPALLQSMIDRGLTGRKGKGGFYRLQKQAGQRVKEALDLTSGAYRASARPQPPALTGDDALRAWLTGEDKAGRYAWEVMSATLAYAAGRVPEIAEDITDIDTALRLGFNWKQGPFQLLDRLGVYWFTRQLHAEGRVIPPLLESGKPLYQVSSGQLLRRGPTGDYRPVPRDEGQLALADVKRRSTRVLGNPAASLWDIGDGIACLEFHSKMNTFDLSTLELIRQSIDAVATNFAALVIHNEGEHFSAGANLNLLVQAIHQGRWDGIEEILVTGQQSFRALKYAPFPVVGAPAGLALGGGCEILLHCDAVQAHAELYMGLVETGIGLIPGWGGCKEYLRRQLANRKRPGGPIPAMAVAFENIGQAKVSQSAFEAQERLFLSPSDGITMNRDRLLADARAKALALTRGYAPPSPAEFRLPGKTGRCAADMALKVMRLLGRISDYDTQVCLQLARVISGGNCDMLQPLSEDDMLALEREAFLHLVRQPATLQRLEYMLKHGRPLRK